MTPGSQLPRPCAGGAARTRDPAGAAPTGDRILDAVLAVLTREGISGVTMRAVAREAGVAVGLANYHFENKNALVADALRRIGEQDAEIVEQPAGEDAQSRLRNSLRHAVDTQFLDPSYLGLRLQLWSLANVDETFAEINQRAQIRYRTGLADLIAAARPDLARAEVERRAADILLVQNGIWLTSTLVLDKPSIARAVTQCEKIAFAK